MAVLSFRLKELASVSSTNDVVKRAIEAGESEGFAVRADIQTSGYGRQGRIWASPQGGLYMSVLLRPAVELSRLSSLSLATALSVRRALALCVKDASTIRVKWPNDIVVVSDDVSCIALEPSQCAYSLTQEHQMCNLNISRDSHSSNSLSFELRSLSETKSHKTSFVYRKLAGMTHEVHKGAVCVGIGVNVTQESKLAMLSEYAKNKPIYISSLDSVQHVCAADLAPMVLNSLARVYDVWQRCGIEALREEYTECSCLDGHVVCVASHEGQVIAQGIARGINAKGCLLLEDPDGVLHSFASGEVHLI